MTIRHFTTNFLHCNFNSHAHVERDTHFTALTLYYTNFNSHAHVERDFCRFCYLLYLDISTHTLTWSVTGVFAIFVKFFTNFNSHAHVERDLCHSLASAVLIISTHTLTWSVTSRFVNTAEVYLQFQLTRSRGAWQADHALMDKDFLFQLTRSRGAWPFQPMWKL